ncbi:hypothetical protein [Clostridium tarantellae]|uniref:Uncharacterized protein n=1 Tax=Clostridium tarantellae TaxID=39493 RepID=A0A6I1MJY6_9CLOT|nr:hypothetical protein [Clostridium tarantellae]MPQ42738.1 hypothetical protein [Clostridium tarantellae]
MRVKENYLVQFNQLINSEDFNFDEYIKSAIFQRRLLNYLNMRGYGYTFRRLMSLFIRKEEGYIKLAKILLQDIDIFEKEELEENTVYSSKGIVRYKREEVLDDLMDKEKRGESYKIFNFQNYLKVFQNNGINKIDVRECLRFEELIINTPVITKDVISYLSKMYRKGIYTKDSPKVLRMINSTSSKSTNTSIELLIESYGRKYTLNYINRIIKAYNIKKDENIDEIVNRILNNNYFYFTEKLIPIMYDFYKRYRDINSLDILCTKCVQNKISLKKYEIKISDIGELIKFYSNLEKYKEKRKVIVSLVDEYSEITLNKNTQELLKV